MNKERVVLIVFIVLIMISPIGYLGYNYSKFSDVANPINPPKNSVQYVVIETKGQFYALTLEEYTELLDDGFKPPSDSSLFNVTVESYITGSPAVDLNMTLRSMYKYFTIILGAPSLENCPTTPALYPGDCNYRTAAVTEISSMVSNIFATNYYLLALQMGYDNMTAKEYAFNQTQRRYRKSYLTFWTKVDIGWGKLGNENHLAVILIGPAEGARENRIFAPRKGTLVIEGITDETLRAEVVLVENIIGFSWPENSTATR